MRKLGLISALFLLVFSLPFAASEKLDITPAKDSFIASENITLKVSLYDDNSNPLNANADVSLEDAAGLHFIKTKVPTNKLVDISLGEKASAGYWKMTAEYGTIKSTALFMVELSELAKFDLKDNVLTVINLGNTRYTKTIQIVIGDTIGSKQLDLAPGESTSFRLIAPEGTYNVKVTDGKTTFTQSGVSLTGKVIGILDNRELSKGPLTTGVQGEESPYGDENAQGPSRNYTLVYMFLLVLFGAGILLAIERRFRIKALSEKPIVTK